MKHPEKPFVSVIVPVYNAGRTLQACLEAILAQDYPPERFEAIVVDNNSGDASPLIASQYPRIRLLQQTSLQSSYASRNLGCAHAQGEIVVFTDADCTPACDWLEQLVIPFKEEAALAVGGIVMDAEAANLVEAFIGEVGLLGKYHEAPGQFLRPLITANAAFRKNIFDHLGGFNANLYTGADIDLAWRLQLRYGDCVRYSSTAIVRHRHRSNLRSMFRQYRRHGFGEIFLDAIYQRYPGYPRTLRYQAAQICRQAWALLVDMRAFVYRLMIYPLKRDRYYLLKPVFWFVAESGNLWGKIQGLWTTRAFRIDPASRQWQDPGG